MKQKKRYFNLRLFFIGFLGMMLGILTFYNLLNIIWLNKVTFWFVLFSLIFVGAVVGIIIFSIKVNFRKFLKYLIFFVLLFVIGASFTAIKVNDITKLKAYDEECAIEGVVDKYYHKDNNTIITLNNVEINDEEISSKITLYLIHDTSVSEDLSLGDKLKTTSELTLEMLVSDRINIEAFTDNNAYMGYATSSSVEIINQKPNIIYALQERLRFVLDKGLNSENAILAYSVLIGDRVDLDEDMQDAFSYSGLSHLLAVSGLNIGFLAGVLTFILNLCRVGRRSRFFIISIILVFYSILCGLCASILRACFMSIVLLLGGVLGEEYDGLNSLGFAGILILLFFPLDLFSPGFQLSFICVFMMITLADKADRALDGFSLPNKSVTSTITISFCTTLGSSIILANTVNSVSLVGIFANLIAIPLFAVAYPLLFLLSIVAMIFPSLSGILVVPEMILHVVKLVANFFAGINWGHFRIFHLGYLILFVFILFSILVKFFMAKKVIKLPICISLALTVIICFVIGIRPIEYDTYALYTNYQYASNSAVLTTNNGKKFLIGLDDYTSTSFLAELKIDYLDAVIIPDFEVNKIDDYLDILEDIKVSEFVLPKNNNYVDFVFDNLGDAGNIKITDTYNNDISVKFIKDDDDVVSGTEVIINDKLLLFTNGITKPKLESLGNYYSNSVDYIITNNSKYNFDDYGIPHEVVLHSNNLEYETEKAISLKNKSYFMLKLG